jgi:DNA-binding winged helix-turn-helix (wHTH) protein/TolB-like protein
MGECESYPVYEFDDFELDVRQRRLTRRGSTEPLNITARAFDTLFYLVEHRDRLVEKSELLAAVWSGLVVEEGNLSTTIYNLRRLLGERPDEHRYIVTVTGRGYRFVAGVVERNAVAKRDNGIPADATPPQAADAPGPGRRHARAAALAAALVLAALAGYLLVWWKPDPSETPTAAVAAKGPVLTPLAAVAVLPFENQTGDPSLDRPGNLLLQTLNLVLREAPQLSVVAQRSADVYAAAGGDARAIAHALGATHLVEIGASQDSEGIKVLARLIDGGVGYQVWSKEFRTKHAAILEGSDDIVLAVAAVIESGAGAVAFEDQDPGTRDVEAFIELLRGFKSYSRLTEAGFVEAISHYEAATRRDPNFSFAWLVLAATHGDMMAFGFERPDSVARFREAVSHAKNSRPDSLAAHMAYATVAVATGQWDEAETHFPAEKQSVAYAVYMQTGRLRDAERILRRVHGTTTSWPVVPLNLALLRDYDRDHQESLSFIEIAVRSGISEDIRPVQALKANAAEAAGRYADAANHMMKLLPPSLRAQGGDAAVHLYYEALEKPGSRPRALAAI